MWTSLLVLALVGMLNPVRLGVTLLVSSAPRPVHSLFAYWLGSLTVGIPALVVPLLVLHFTPVLRTFTHDWATPTASPTVRHIQIGLGVLALSAAAVLTGHSLRRRTAPADPTRPPDEPGAAVPGEGGSTIRGLLGRLGTAWEKGSLWVAWVIGLLVGPAPDVIVFALAIIVASGAAIHTQVVAAVGYVVGMLAVVETILVSYLATPAKTQAALRVLHNWASAHRRQLLVAVLAVLGVSMLAHGING